MGKMIDLVIEEIYYGKNDKKERRDRKSREKETDDLNFYK
jgi:hypothetical protein